MEFKKGVVRRVLGFEEEKGGIALKAMDNQNPKKGPMHSMCSRKGLQPWIFPFLIFPLLSNNTLLNFQNFLVK